MNPKELLFKVVRNVCGARWNDPTINAIRFSWSTKTPEGASPSSAAWSALSALMWHYSALCGYVDGHSEQYTTGIREAYAAGLEIAMPVAPGVLGWSHNSATRETKVE